MIRTPGADLERIQTPHVREDDEAEQSLRPRRLDEFVGQPALKAQLEVSIQAAAARGEALDHVLLAGPPGLGKTRSPGSSPRSSRSASCRPPARRWSARATSPPS